MSSPNPSPESLKRGYEHGNPRIRWFVTAVIGLALFAAFMYAFLWYLVKADSHHPLVDQRLSAITGYASTPSAAPPLQPSPQHDRTAAEDLETMRHSEDQVFLSLGWHVDPATHRATPPASLVQLVAKRFQTQGGAK
ncbi:MAG TPA: hypothetical protein VFE58_11410 [Tepidisphaeraceae bacterium]|jgi:hypothetical protein|nr:hypothetical protein [Tepidisphaeraceae bacterium]